MTDEELQAIKARVEAVAATCDAPAPWAMDTFHRGAPSDCEVRVTDATDSTIYRVTAAFDDMETHLEQQAIAEFIAHARTDVPALLAEVARLRAALALYAEPRNWHSPSTGFALQYDPEPSPVQRDRGDAARAALG